MDRVFGLLGAAWVLFAMLVGTAVGAIADNAAAATTAGIGAAAIGLFTLMFNSYRKEIRRITVKCARSERVNDLLLESMYAHNIPVPAEVRVLQGLTNGASK